MVVPLGLDQSRGDQIENAAIAVKDGTTLSISEEALSIETLTTALKQLDENSDQFKAEMAKAKFDKGGKTLLAEILKSAA